MSNIIDSIPAEVEFFKDTRTLMKKETIELLFRSDVYNLRINVHRASQQGNDMKDYDIPYNDYEEATRKVWVIENLIKDRIGYYPKQLTENFLSLYLQRIEESQKSQCS